MSTITTIECLMVNKQPVPADVIKNAYSRTCSSHNRKSYILENGIFDYEALCSFTKYADITIDDINEILKKFDLEVNDDKLLLASAKKHLFWDVLKLTEVISGECLFRIGYRREGDINDDVIDKVFSIDEKNIKHIMWDKRFNKFLDKILQKSSATPEIIFDILIRYKTNMTELKYEYFKRTKEIPSSTFICRVVEELGVLPDRIDHLSERTLNIIIKNGLDGQISEEIPKIPISSALYKKLPQEHKKFYTTRYKD